MEREERLNSGNQWYNDSCPSCSYKTEAEDIVVDAFFILKDVRRECIRL